MRIIQKGAFGAISLVVLGVMSGAYAADYKSCSSYQSANELYDDRVEDDGYVECSVTPDVARLVVYEIALCSDRPSPGSAASCASIFTDVNGRTLDISPQAAFNLLDEVSLPDGTYTHAFMRFSNTVAVRASQAFNFDVTDANGSTGLVCYTNNGTGEGNVSCGSTANPSFSSEVVSVLGFEGEGDVPDDGIGDPGPIFFFRDIPSSTNRPFDAYILDASGAISASAVSSTEIMAVIQLETPAQISMDTSSIDVGFKATDMVAFAMRPCDRDANGTASDCVEQGFIGGFDFYARAK